jgi:GT2 family glycosyltransferase
MLSFCISTYNNLEYLKLAVQSVRKNSYFKDAPFIIHAENCDDGTDEWLDAYHQDYNLDYYIEKNPNPVGIGGGMNFCAEKVQTEYIMFLHSDFYVSKNWDKACLDVFEKYPNKKLWVNSWRIEPQMFPSSQTSPGNLIVPKDTFGEYYNNFNSEMFDKWAYEFTHLNDIEVPRGLGVSALIRKKDWNEIGGNDPIFAPTSWDDHDLFLRMVNSGFKFVTTSKSLIYHFGARGSHRLEENNNTSSKRQIQAEQINAQKFISKWGGLPTFDSYGQINGIRKI